MPESMQAVERALKSINSAITHLRFYGDGHPIVRQGLDAAYRNLSNLLACRDETTLLLIESELVWNDRPLSGQGQPYARLMRDLEERGIESITFTPHLGREEFIAFVKDMAQRKSDSICSSGNIKFGKLLLKTQGAALPAAPAIDPSGGALGAFEALRSQKLADLQEIYSQIVRM